MIFAKLSTTGILKLVRGDSFSASIYLNSGTELEPIQYVLKAEDKLYFALMQYNEYFENAIVKKVLTTTNEDDSHNVILELKPEDTEHLLPGKYYYQIKLVTTNDSNEEEVVTVVNKSLFYIEE